MVTASVSSLKKYFFEAFRILPVSPFSLSLLVSSVVENVSSISASVIRFSGVALYKK